MVENERGRIGVGVFDVERVQADGFQPCRSVYLRIEPHQPHLFDAHCTNFIVPLQSTPFGTLERRRVYSITSEIIMTIIIGLSRLLRLR